ncbi:pentapeptide repeat-containing protein [uncultured Tateyamaria sp.]|uniref:pentapeptide repeat-containing protein n=1 Tax=uncultured Tateyamaria sp. TaxID=455651 RepID=UPI002614D257|nr:pentapeptide repeat-containing protein [uncultured Tateyamaria sp.]
MSDFLSTALSFLAVAVGVPLLGVCLAFLIDVARRKDVHARLGLDRVHPALVLIGITLYGAIALLLIAGLIILIAGAIALPFKDGQSLEETQREYLFYVLRIAGLTTVVGAMIALPFTVIRLRLSQEQTETARESLFNDKINEATKGLYARRQISKWHRQKGYIDHWEDDIVQRNAAIDRLEGLAQEKPTEVPRIARLLSVYVRELSAEVHAKTPPPDATPETLRDWARTLPKLRSDMEKAAQTLGRLADIAPDPLVNGEIDLRGANLQAADLRHAKFEQASLRGAQLQGADLDGAQLQRADLFSAQLQRADLFSAQLQVADLRRAQLQAADLDEAQLQRANLIGAQLKGANAYRAQLQGAILIDAQLQGADLYRAQLQGADLYRAQLQGTDLFTAQLQGADLGEAAFDKNTSLTAANLRGAAVRDVDFTATPQIADHLADIFGDASTALPNGVIPDHPDWPAHWPRTRLDLSEFRDAWRIWQSTLPKGWDDAD